jgi:hypothetical protein
MLAPMNEVIYSNSAVTLAFSLACFMLLLNTRNDELARMADESFFKD